MFMNVSCPKCGHKWRVPESCLGQQVRCPGCSSLFQCGSVSPGSLTLNPVPAEGPSAVRVTPQARATQPEFDQGIHYRCPRCTKPLESPAHLAGQKVSCPDCGQRLQIPQSSAPPAAAPVNKTVLAVEEQPGSIKPQVRVVASPAAAPPPVKEDAILTVVPVVDPAPPARRESCLECGAEVTDRPRVLTCPDCGSLFCSAMCFREHRRHAHPSWGR
jgi:DNA-directed RNA polymerase subunit RPC12/RpoP